MLFLSPSTGSGQALVHNFALRLPCLRQASPPEAGKLQTVSHRNAPHDKLWVFDPTRQARRLRPRGKLGICDMPGVHKSFER